MPRHYRALSRWFTASRVRMAVLIVAVLATLVGFGIYQARGGEQSVSWRAAAVVGLVWALMLAVLWFDEGKRTLARGQAWSMSILLDLFVVFLLVMMLRP